VNRAAGSQPKIFIYWTQMDTDFSRQRPNDKKSIGTRMNADQHGSLPEEKTKRKGGNLARQSSAPLYKRKAVKKFNRREGKAFFAARGRGKFTPPKPGGR
jgi:hypothetical protein